jgi:hypothetical protein
LIRYDVSSKKQAVALYLSMGNPSGYPQFFGQGQACPYADTLPVNLDSTLIGSHFISPLIALAKLPKGSIYLRPARHYHRNAVEKGQKTGLRRALITSILTAPRFSGPYLSISPS